MKKIKCLVLLQVLLFILALPSVFAGGNSDQSRQNRIVIYTSMYEDVIQSVKNELDNKFPAYNIEFVYGGTGALQDRIAAEESSGRLGCDILLLAEPAYSLELKEKGMLHSFNSSEASSLAFDYDDEGYWYPVRISNMVLAYNPERNSKNDIPGSFLELANDSSVRGSISMSNPLVSGTALAAIAALEARYGRAYFEALGRQNVMIDSGAVALQKLESGECRVAMILEESVLRIRQQENSRIEVIYPADGTIVIPSTIVIISDSWSANRNTRNAEAITGWFLSAEGQDVIVDAWMHSVRASFRQPFDAVSTGEIRANSMPVNWENLLKQKDEIIESFENNVTHNR